MAEGQALCGIKVCVQLTKAAQSNKQIKRTLERELEELGAKCAQRLGKNCTHVVLQHKTDDPAEEDRAADDKSARELAEKLETMGTGIQLVRPSWIAASREAGQEADVAQHLVVIPKVDPLLQRLRNGSSARPSTGKKRSALRTHVPASPENYKMSQLVSSSQQINRPDDDGAECAPPPPAKRPATRRGAQKNQLQEPTGFDTQACASVLSDDLPVASRSASPAPETDKPMPPTKQTRGRGRKQGGEAADEQPSHQGAEALAAVAGQLAGSPAAALARRNGRRGAAPAPSSELQCPSAADSAAAEEPLQPAAAAEEQMPPPPQQQQQQQRPVIAACRRAAPAPVRRPRTSGQAAFKPPRLAEAAAKRDSLAAAAAAAEAEYAKMLADEAANASADEDEAADADITDAAAAREASAGGAAATQSDDDIEEWPEANTQRAYMQRGPSIRHLAAAPEKALAISTATPAGYRPSPSPAMPTAAAPAARSIVVPGVVRMPTPAEPTQTTVTTGPAHTQEAPDSVAPTSRPAAIPTPAAASVAMPQVQPPRQKEAPWSAARPWDRRDASTEDGADEVEDSAAVAEDGAAVAGAGAAARKGGKPAAKARPAAQAAKGKAQKRRATAGAAASTAKADVEAPTAGKQKAAAGSKRAAPDVEDQENPDPRDDEPGPARKRRAAGVAKPAAAKPAVAAAGAGNASKAATRATASTAPASAKAAGKAAGAASKAAGKAAAAPRAGGRSAAAGGSSAAAPKPATKRGVLSTSKLDPEMTTLVQAVVKEVPGFTWCPKGMEARITHLVLGADRNLDSRTEKLLLAVANGAHILTTEWLTASREARRWLPEADFTAKCKFTAVAERARQAKEAGKPLRPLATPQAVTLAVHAGGKACSGMSSGKDKGASKAVLEKLATALGAKLVSMRECDYCIVSRGGGGRPKGLKDDAKALRDDWLLAAAESLTAPKITHRQLIED